MKLTTTPSCDFCRSPLPPQYYEPRNSKRGMHVFVCNQCGLIQSISTKEYASRPEPSMSCDADRASIKYTKDLVLKPHLKILESGVDLESVKNILDVGSNRGAFLTAVISLNPSVKVTAVETDAQLMTRYNAHPQVHALNQRLETTRLDPESFDLIYCAHTLEHFSAAASMIIKLCEALKPGGFLFIAVPNALIVSEDTFEETFIDTHTFHFHVGVLNTFFKACGLQIAFSALPGSFELYYLLQKTSDTGKLVPQSLFSPANAKKSQDFFEDYKRILTRNRKRLETAAKHINSLSSENRIVFWGAGRIFDGLVKIGGLDTVRIVLLVDKYLFRYMPEVHGVAIKPPEVLSDYPKDTTIIIASREYEKEIADEARQMGFSDIWGYAHFMAA